MAGFLFSQLIEQEHTNMDFHINTSLVLASVSIGAMYAMHAPLYMRDIVVYSQIIYLMLITAYYYRKDYINNNTQ